jgi:hypothetical protein
MTQGYGQVVLSICVFVVCLLCVCCVFVGVCLWCVCGVFGVCLVCVWYVFGVCLVCVWCVFGVCLLCVWCVFVSVVVVSLEADKRMGTDDAGIRAGHYNYCVTFASKDFIISSLRIIIRDIFLFIF